MYRAKIISISMKFQTFTCILAILAFRESLAAMNLTSNRCNLAKILTVEPEDKSNKLLTVRSTGFIKMLNHDLTLLDELQTPNGMIKDNYYCSFISTFNQYGNLISPVEVSKIKHNGQVYGIRIIYIRSSMTSKFCIFNGAVLSVERCKIELSKFALLLKLDPPTLPSDTSISNYKLFNNDQNFTSHPLLYQPGVKLTFQQDPVQTICGDDVYFAHLDQLTRQLEEYIQQNIYTIYSFIKDLISEQFPRKIILTNDEVTVRKFSNFRHAPLIYREHLANHFSFEFPELQYAAHGEPLPDTQAFRIYVNFIDIINNFNHRHRRGIWDLFSDSPALGQLIQNSKVSTKAFNKIRKNSKRLYNNQRHLNLGINKMIVNEQELAETVKRQSHRTHQITLNFGSLRTFMTRKIDRLIEIERYENLISLAHTQLTEIRSSIEELSVSSPYKCHAQPQESFSLLCASHYPFFRKIGDEIYLMYEATRHGLVSQFNIECLPFNRKIFKYSGHDIIIEGEKSITTDKEEFATLCFSSTRMCENDYIEKSPSHMFGPCAYLTNGEQLAINCHKPSILRTGDGRQMTIHDDPEVLAMSALPLTLEGVGQLGLGDVMAILAPDITVPRLDQTNDKLDISDSINAPVKVPKAQEQVEGFQESFDNFVTPDSVRISHVFATLTILMFICLFITICCICGRNPRLAQCCGETSDLVTPSSGCMIMRLCCPRRNRPSAPPAGAMELQERLLPGRRDSAPIMRSSSAPSTQCGSGCTHHPPLYPDLPASGFPTNDPAPGPAPAQTRQSAGECRGAHGMGPPPGNDTGYIAPPPTAPTRSPTKLLYKDGGIVIH